MQLRSEDFQHNTPIPAEFAFCKPGGNEGPVALSANRNPQLSWSDAPEGTRSFVLVCIDPDVPSKGDDVNQEGRSVPADLPRVEFAHWLMVDIPASCDSIAAGSCSSSITAHGKRAPQGPAGSRQGRNDYTDWFASDVEMAGDYFGYDGPCPPWNDTIVHRYQFRIHALDVERLPVSASFRWPELQAAMEGHVLDQAELIGMYSLNPAVGGR